MRTIGVSIEFDMIHENSLDRENNRLSRLLGRRETFTAHSSQPRRTLAPGMAAG